MEKQLAIIAYLIATFLSKQKGEKRTPEEIIEDAAGKVSKPEKRTPSVGLPYDIEAVERIYALYPSKTDTPEGQRSTGKCFKDKERIGRLLRTHTPEQIENAIKKYVEEQAGMYLKNFSTFLNNLPEYEQEPKPQDEAQGYIDF